MRKQKYFVATLKLGQYHDQYVQSNTLLLADVSENLRNMYLQIYELDHDKNSFSSQITQQATLKIQN